jgi:hypothetical protein
MNPPLSFTQKLITTFLPKSWAEWMKAESMRWQMRCTTCNHTLTVWEAGGIRAGAVSKGKISLMYCKQCGTLRGHAVEPVPGK